MVESSKINLSILPYPIDMNLTIPGRKCYILFTNYKVNNDLKIFFVLAENSKTGKCERKYIRIYLRTDLTEVDLCYQGKYHIKTNEKIKTIKKSSKYNLIKIFPKA